jgi:hypothetical protein
MPTAAAKHRTEMGTPRTRKGTDRTDRVGVKV